MICFQKLLNSLIFSLNSRITFYDHTLSCILKFLNAPKIFLLSNYFEFLTLKQAFHTALLKNHPPKFNLSSFSAVFSSSSDYFFNFIQEASIKSFALCFLLLIKLNLYFCWISSPNDSTFVVLIFSSQTVSIPPSIKLHLLSTYFMMLKLKLNLIQKESSSSSFHFLIEINIFFLSRPISCLKITFFLQFLLVLSRKILFSLWRMFIECLFTWLN